MRLKVLFGKRLKQIRQEQSKTQETLAEAVGVSIEFISNMERGINAPSFTTLQRLSDALNTPVKDFFDFSTLTGVE